MPLRCILVPTGPGVRPERRLEAALGLAKRTHAHINALYVRPDLQIAVPPILPVGAAGILPQCNDSCEAKALAAAGQQAFERWCAGARVAMRPNQRLDATFASWNEKGGDVETLVALNGRVSDLIIVDNPAKAGPFEAAAFDAAVFSSGRPALMLGERLPDNLLRHVVIAWNGSLEGARVVGQSISLLHEAEQISIITIPSEQDRQAGIADLGDYLHWHGVVVENAALVPDFTGSGGERILAACHHAAATLLVMGAYTHSRLRQAFLGGLTQHVLDKADLPVLMAH
ncbi:universal stress protein [Labrys sp. La1]|uniref:universal stress protein n=1 Tax=Labrys sp. La1 TaxID=3404917 RepID=UPI003EC07556